MGGSAPRISHFCVHGQREVVEVDDDEAREARQTAALAGALPREPLHHVETAPLRLGGGNVEWCRPGFVSYVDVRAALTGALPTDPLHHVEVALLGGDVERRGPVVGRQVDVRAALAGALPRDPLDHVEVARSGGGVERRGPGFRRQVDVCAFNKREGTQSTLHGGDTGTTGHVCHFKSDGAALHHTRCRPATPRTHTQRASRAAHQARKNVDAHTRKP